MFLYGTIMYIMSRSKIPSPLSFDWDEHNKDKNWIRHKVSVKESEQVFANHPTLVFKDKKHSQREARYTILGQTNKHRTLAITYTMRNKNIRIISARDMNRKEKEVYEQKTK